MRPESELALEPANDGPRIRLNAGSVIVTAAKHGGHLYVQTKDVSVSVVGTVFLVNAEQAGSRVAVIQGEVQVQQGATSRKLAPGEQVASNPLMESHPVPEEIAWSRHAEEHLALLQRSAANATPELLFEAGTVKPDPEENPFAGFSCRGVDGVLTNGMAVRNPPEYPIAPPAPLGRCVGSASLRTLLSLTYDARGERIIVDNDSGQFYRIEAKAEFPSTTTKEQLLQMLRNFVIDRFKLRVHRKIEEGAGYILQVAKNGVKFKEASGEEDTSQFVVRGSPVALPKGGQTLPWVIKANLRMSSLVRFLSGVPTAGMPIIDKTDLPGIYDVNLTLNRIRGGSGEGGPRGGNSAPQDSFDPPVSKALEEQLGLQLTPNKKVPVEFIVVDHLEEPSN
jgi:uncharacterized protein (TIGR03435 family)